MKNMSTKEKGIIELHNHPFIDITHLEPIVRLLELIFANISIRLTSLPMPPVKVFAKFLMV